jgi:hypothetical protein
VGFGVLSIVIRLTVYGGRFVSSILTGVHMDIRYFVRNKKPSNSSKLSAHVADGKTGIARKEFRSWASELDYSVSCYCVSSKLLKDI